MHDLVELRQYLQSASLTATHLPSLLKFQVLRFIFSVAEPTETKNVGGKRRTSPPPPTCNSDDDVTEEPGLRDQSGLPLPDPDREVGTPLLVLF